MAGWKLRKDKAQTEESVTETEPAVAAMEAESPTQWETLPDADQIHTGAILDLGHTEVPTDTPYAPPPPEPDFETGSDLHFDDEEAKPIAAEESSFAPSLPVEASIPPSVPLPATAEFSPTLRMNREELATAFAPPAPTGIPSVAPFVLDTPLVSPATADTPPRLVVRVGRLSGAFDLSNDVTVIGRPDSKIQHYPDVEIDLDDAVSRRHAEVIKRDDRYYLRDAGSTNGTLLNGERLPAHEERLLTHGDRIRVGERTEIVFE